MKYQYIGYGDTPPESIKFMGLVRFRLNGPYVDVLDQKVLDKLKTHRCFKVKTESQNSVATKKRAAKQAKTADK